MNRPDFSRYEGHAPGPWEYEDYGQLIYAHNGHCRVADVRGWGHLSTHNEADEAEKIQDATGKLMADAPLLKDYALELEAKLERSMGLLRKARGKLQMYPIETRRVTTKLIDAFLTEQGA